MFGRDSTAKESAPGLLGTKARLRSLSLGVEPGRVCRTQNKDTCCLGRGFMGQRQTCSLSTHIQCILGCFRSCPAVKDHKTNRLVGKRENTLAFLPTFISPSTDRHTKNTPNNEKPLLSISFPCPAGTGGLVQQKPPSRHHSAEWHRLSFIHCTQRRPLSKSLFFF